MSFVSRVTFEAFCESNPEIYRHVIVLLARRLRDTNGALAATSFLSLKGRVARALLILAAAFGQDVGADAFSCGKSLSKTTLRRWPALRGKMSAEY